MKLKIGLILLGLSGFLIGYGIGKVYHQRLTGVAIGLGITLFINGIFLFKNYIIERRFENRKEIYRKH